MRLKTFILCLLASVAVWAGTLPEDGPLTIDAELQALGERLLQNKQGSIVAIEPMTGRILALVNQDKVNDGVNRAIAMEYSPGSTFKTAQALEMLSEGTLTPDKTYPCSRGFTYNGIRIGCHAHRSPLALVQAIGQSCNSYFCKAFQEMLDNRETYDTQYRAINRWHAYMQSMGLGRTLGVDLPDEAPGVMPDSAYLSEQHGNWNGTTVMWVGMGQGEVKTTPLQLCNLAAVIANRGYYITPHIHADTLRNTLDQRYEEKHYSLATPEAFDIVIKGMRAAVVSGTAAAINTPDYPICGKTGTAENEGEDHSIFMGFAPMDNPRIAVSVYVENGGFGADLAAPLAALMIEKYIMGQLSDKSEQQAAEWEAKNVKITPVEVEVSFDDL
ncbi:MAG: peptidoglycan D,D-transpeptidase FtsI family protein [Prevotella sp.]